MNRSFVIAVAMTLATTSACLAADCSKSSACQKKVSLMSKLLHKKVAVEAKKSAGDTDMQLSGTNFIIN